MESKEVAIKIQEGSVQATETINCLRIGRKSGRVFALGGSDCKISVYTLGNVSPLVSLAGQTGAISCLTFDSQEELIAAGSTKGIVKVWD